jgi:hypothetical protein
MTDAGSERHDHDEWREQHPEAALAEAISVAIGCILTHEPNEALRKQSIGVLMECHQRALAEALTAVRLRLN